MIKVKVDRPAPNVFYVEEGYTVSYSDDVLEVLNDDDETIAVFRDWAYAMPTDEYEEEPELEEGEVLDLDGVQTVVADFLSQPEYASSVHANSRGDHAEPDAATEAQGE